MYAPGLDEEEEDVRELCCIKFTWRTLDERLNQLRIVGLSALRLRYKQLQTYSTL